MLLKMPNIVALITVLALAVIVVGDENNKLVEFPQVVDSESKALSQRLNRFSYNLLEEILDKNPDDNIVLGDASIISLMSMTLLGTVGDSYAELADALGFSQDILENRKNHEQFGALLDTLQVSNGSRTVIAAAVLVRQNETLRAVYRQYLERVYRADAVPVDFDQTVRAKDFINNWVDKHTDHRIQVLLDQPLVPDTRMVLLSAHHFSGQWKTPFYPELTKDLPFYRKDGTKQLVPQMVLQEKLPYFFSKQHECHIVGLPYNDSSNTMYLLMPYRRDKPALADLLSTLKWSDIEVLINSMHETDTVVRIPKMKIESTANLTPSLKSMGIKSIFDQEKGNFALMVDGDAKNKSEDELLERINNEPNEVEAKGLKEKLQKLTNPGLYISSVMHKVYIKVNEWGTEAASVTAGFFPRSAGRFAADSPFLLFIRNDRTGLVTLGAVINAPGHFHE